ncbi:hypothetical protein G9A89_009449 [Geosiphon pyriformis]|nr:hypothetical protein G9A89_009449 [Geosiphon pyriformis]
MNYEERNVFNKDDSTQMSKGPKLVAKKALNMPLEKINFLSNVDDNDIFLNAPVFFSLPLKNLVNVSVKKNFALDIGLNKVAEKLSYDKFVAIRKLFSKVNGFGKVSTPSKFAKIIYASFISEFSLAQAMKKARAINVLVNTDLKKFFMHSD